MEVRGYFFVSFITAASILCGVAAVNYVVDVSGIYHTSAYQDYVANYVRRLVASQNGLRAIVFERAVKIELARSIAADCYVLGSSHQLGVAPDRVPAIASECHSTINLAVSGGSYPDAVMQLAIVARRAPKVVYIGLGPWFFKTEADLQWTEFADAYYEARSFFELPEVRRLLPTGKFANLFNADYLIRNVEQIVARKPINTLPAMLEVAPGGANIANEDAIYRPDGSFTYSRRFRDEADSRETVECFDFKIVQPYIDPIVVREFDRILRSLRAMNVGVRLLLMPYHPAVWNCAGNTKFALKAVEQLVTAMAMRWGIEVVGSYDSERFSLLPRDFYDFMHLNISGLSKIVR